MIKKIDLETELNALKAYKKERVRIGTLVVKENGIPELISLCAVDSKVSHQACWCLEQSFLLFPDATMKHIDAIANLYNQELNSSAMRSLSKIASVITKKYYSKRSHPFQKQLTKEHREHFVTGCFYTLITHTDCTANMAMATNSLYELGKEFEWIYPELVPTIERLLTQTKTKGYRASAAKVLDAINT
ncbi:adenylosuccinate lyase [Nonlabens sp. MIC269]|uniref:hypothetical protein n=1 Tax=Nonlabens TaxID=363408 RepID=UPI0005A7289A|nr:MULTISPECIES: hypothetical protein [Nonlabens]ALM21742.1 adenylosuccinate lyase [Nonlabens sp. MIC269]ARN71526.1 adenylosuccinate lyase [Nonlabens tegetincola]MEE2801139.1 adenylosuccinate lyase [Bacteroidota bacterium]